MRFSMLNKLLVLLLFVSVIPLAIVGYSMISNFLTPVAMDATASQPGEYLANIYWLAFFYLIMSLIMVFLAGLFYIRFIFLPLKKLTDVSNKIKSGDLGIQFPAISSKDEIEDLSDTIQLLVRAINYLKMEKQELIAKTAATTVNTTAVEAKPAATKKVTKKAPAKKKVAKKTVKKAPAKKKVTKKKTVAKKKAPVKKKAAKKAKK